MQETPHHAPSPTRFLLARVVYYEQLEKGAETLGFETVRVSPGGDSESDSDLCRTGQGRRAGVV